MLAGHPHAAIGGSDDFVEASETCLSRLLDDRRDLTGSIVMEQPRWQQEENAVLLEWDDLEIVGSSEEIVGGVGFWQLAK